MKHFILSLILLITFGYCFAGEITVHDIYGRTVILPDKVERTIALGTGALRFMVYAGVQDTLVGREKWDVSVATTLRPFIFALPEDFEALPVISQGGRGSLPDTAAIIMAEADVIFTVGYSIEQMDYISNATHIPVVGLSYGEEGHTELEKVKESLRLLGYVTGSQRHTQDIMNNMAMMRKDLISRTENAPSKAVRMISETHHEGSEKPVCRLLNISDILAHNAEELLSGDPEYIFIDVMGYKWLSSGYKKIYPALSKVKAVRNGKVYSVMPCTYSNIENIYITAYFMGKILYPDRFADVNLEDKADDIYNLFLGINPYPDIMKRGRVYKKAVFTKEGISFR